MKHGSISARSAMLPCRDWAGFMGWLRARRRLALWITLFGLLVLMVILAIAAFMTEDTDPAASLHLDQVRVKPAQLPEPPRLEVVQAMQQKLDAFDPTVAVAFAIPVGGRTQRAVQLGEILRTLLKGGAPASHVFVVEDVQGRPGKVNDAAVARVAKEHGVRVLSSYVGREDMPEDHTNFGIHLARHYKFMLDYLLVGPEAMGSTPDPTIATPFEYLVLIEDDLVLSADFVKFFHAMSRVMAVDDSLYCVSAHQDNAFYGTSYEPPAGSVTSLDQLGFDFRRGNHFMAPGWMTSRSIYTSVVRPKWLDSKGQYAYKAQLHLRNGHWDRFFDSLIGDKDCIFPEIPRISHQGADGFTVDQRAQMELYSNLKLSTLDVDVNYGDLQRMTKDGYIAAQLAFIAAATRLTSLEEIRSYRQAKLVFVMPTRDDKDEAWNTVLNGFFGLIGVGGYGGYEGYVKVRGIFHGAVYVRWLTNLIMLVGAYSPYLAAAEQRPYSLDLDMTYGGCFYDKGHSERDLEHHVAYYKPGTLSPRACLSSCIHLGYRYAGLQAGMECWCGHSYGRHGAVQADSSKGCENTCGGGGAKALATTAQAGAKEPVTCGGDWKNSVYWHNEAPSPTAPTAVAPRALMHERVVSPPADAVFIKGASGESCTAACSAASTPLRRLACAEMLFPLLHRHCSLLQSLIGCTSCGEEEDMTRGVYSPGGFPNAKCSLSKGRYIRCSAKPNNPNYLRACVCQVQPEGLQQQTRTQALA